MAWQEKMIVILGGATGLAQSIAGAFAAQGATVVLADRSREALQAARAAIGGRTYPALADLRDEAHVAQLFEPLAQVDVLVCCAGVGEAAPLEDVTPEALAMTVETGVYGSYWAARHALPRMSAGGSIIFIVPGLAPHASAQSMVGGAVEALTRALAAEGGRRGVCVNCISLASGDEADLKGDVVGMVQLLAGAAHITGSVVEIGGGAGL